MHVKEHGETDVQCLTVNYHHLCLYGWLLVQKQQNAQVEFLITYGEKHTRAVKAYNSPTGQQKQIFDLTQFPADRKHIINIKQNNELVFTRGRLKTSVRRHGRLWWWEVTGHWDQWLVGSHLA